MAKYVVISENLFTQRDWERFGCAELAARGYDVMCVQLDRALGRDGVMNPQGVFQVLDSTVSPATLADLENIIAFLRPADLVLVVALLSDATRPLFRMLRTHRVRYAAMHLGNIPMTSMRSLRAAVSVREFLALRIEDFRGFLWLIRWLLREMTKQSFEYFRLQPPYLWLTAGTAISSLGARLPRAWSARRVSVASFDYLSAVKKADVPDVDTGTAVFLDEAFTDHPDFAFLGMRSPASPDRYWPALERLFGAVEARTGLKVIIAPHPKSKGAPPFVSKERWAEAGRTAALVRQSRLVLCHVSTAVSFAVMFRKPIMFVTTNEIEQSSYRGRIARMSSRFSSRRVNADRFAPEEIRIPPVDEQIYARYEAEYLKAPGADAKLPWDLLQTEMCK